MKTQEHWQPLIHHYDKIKAEHLKDLLSDQERNKNLVFKYSDFILDLTHEKINL